MNAKPNSNKEFGFLTGTTGIKTGLLVCRIGRNTHSFFGFAFMRLGVQQNFISKNMLANPSYIFCSFTDKIL